jgi:hypothetical protein
MPLPFEAGGTGLASWRIRTARQRFVRGDAWTAIVDDCYGPLVRHLLGRHGRQRREKEQQRREEAVQRREAAVQCREEAVQHHEEQVERFKVQPQRHEEEPPPKENCERRSRSSRELSCDHEETHNLKTTDDGIQIGRVISEAAGGQELSRWRARTRST